MKTLSFDVGGMTCSDCTDKVQHALNKLNGVSHAEVTLKPGVATAMTDPDYVDAKLLESVITQLGYTAKERAVNPAHA